MSKAFNEHGTQMAEFKELGDEALHGDVIITRDRIPNDFETYPIVENSCLALGEATGHRHQLFGEEGTFTLRENPQTKVKYLRVIKTVDLKHQEHSPIILPPGEYRIGIQKEYDPFEKLVRQVAD